MEDEGVKFYSLTYAGQLFRMSVPVVMVSGGWGKGGWVAHCAKLDLVLEMESFD